jgi:hypothetical protein
LKVRIEELEFQNWAIEREKEELTLKLKNDAVEIEQLKEKEK